MSGKPKYNKDAFDAAESHWVDRGHEVFNPSSQGYDAPPSEHYKTYLPQDIRDVLDCDAVVVLPGWYRSRGAMLEVIIAKLLDKAILNEEDGSPVYDFAVEASPFTLTIIPT